MSTTINKSIKHKIKMKQNIREKNKMKTTTKLNILWLSLIVLFLISFAIAISYDHNAPKIDPKYRNMSTLINHSSGYLVVVNHYKEKGWDDYYNTVFIDSLNNSRVFKNEYNFIGNIGDTLVKK